MGCRKSFGGVFALDENKKVNMNNMIDDRRTEYASELMIQTTIYEDILTKVKQVFRMNVNIHIKCNDEEEIILTPGDIDSHSAFERLLSRIARKKLPRSSSFCNLPFT